MAYKEQIGFSNSCDKSKTIREEFLSSLPVLVRNEVDSVLSMSMENSRVSIFQQLVKQLRTVDNDWMDDKTFTTFSEKVKKSVLDNPGKQYDSTRCTVDILNAIGACVVAGNIRRSSELIMGNPGDETFINLKNYTINPERESIGWMSNNTIRLSKTEDFLLLPKIAERIRDNGEPGVYNQINVHRYGRIGRYHSSDDLWTRESEVDRATLSNPCGEICLEPFELCNLSEVFPTRCIEDSGVASNYGAISKEAEQLIYQALRYATFYSSSVSLLPTHWEITNAVIARNRRIGVSLSGIADLHDIVGFTEVTRLCRAGYKIVREANTRYANEAGVPPSIRVTTIKPSGSISQLVGVSSGMHFPTFRYAIRRMRVSDDSPIVPILKRAGYFCEKDGYSDNTLVFEFPIDHGNTRSAEEVTIWEQFALLSALGREWSDNMISCTIYFNPDSETNQIEKALAQYAPVIKSCSMLPHVREGVYKQAPYQGITKDVYEKRLAEIKPINWSSYGGSDGMMPKGCSNDSCAL